MLISVSQVNDSFGLRTVMTCQDPGKNCAISIHGTDTPTIEELQELVAAYAEHQRMPPLDLDVSYVVERVSL